ncbi:MAG: type II toxin-antitoxin system RelE/ParE family toxin [Proteobacteria bacterium]|nr:type II toxin-antitoxin system RelE/ParE family toxin [Pseudomonadota bacterium]
MTEPKTVVFAAAAMDDLLGIADHVEAATSRRAARRLLDQLAATAESLADHPERAPSVTGLVGVRGLQISRWTILYSVGEAEVRVLRFWHERRDPSSVELDP